MILILVVFGITILLVVVWMVALDHRDERKNLIRWLPANFAEWMRDEAREASGHLQRRKHS